MSDSKIYADISALKVFERSAELEQENAELKRDANEQYMIGVEAGKNTYKYLLIKAEEKYLDLERIIAESQKQKPVLWVDMNDVEKLKLKDIPVRCIHGQYDADYSPLFASPIIQEGMQLVPIEPTHKMLYACVDVEIGGSDYQLTLSFEEAKEIYKAMLNASKE